MVSKKFKDKPIAILCAEIKGDIGHTDKYEVEAVRSCLRQHGIVVSPIPAGKQKHLAAHKINVFQDSMATIIQKYGGRIADSAGENLLCEFAGALDAMQCAAEIQKVLRVKNTKLPGYSRTEFRIGISFKDVIDNGDLVYINGIIIATQIVRLADEGGICISESVLEQIENKLPLRYEFLGEHKIKNIPKPIRVYRVLKGAEAVVSRKKNLKV